MSSSSPVEGRDSVGFLGGGAAAAGGGEARGGCTGAGARRGGSTARCGVGGVGVSREGACEVSSSQSGSRSRPDGDSFEGGRAETTVTSGGRLGRVSGTSSGSGGRP